MFGHFEPVNHCCFSPDDAFVSTSSNDGTVKVTAIQHHCQNVPMWILLTSSMTTGFFFFFCTIAAVSGVVCQRVEDDQCERQACRKRRGGPGQVQHLDCGWEAHHMCSQKRCSGGYFSDPSTHPAEAAVCYSVVFIKAELCVCVCVPQSLLCSSWHQERLRADLCSLCHCLRCLMWKHQTCCWRLKQAAWAWCSTATLVLTVTSWLLLSQTTLWRYIKSTRFILFATFLFKVLNTTIGLYCGGFFQLWDLEANKKMADCSGHLSWVQRVQFSTDGSQLLSCSDDQTIRVRLGLNLSTSTLLTGLLVSPVD